MPDERTPSAKRPYIKERAQAEARLDHERAALELKRFLDLAVSEMGLAIDCAISTPASVAGAPDDKDVVVAFRGEDQDFLLERNAELLLALEHVAHRWLHLDPRLHDRVRFDCGDYRAGRLEELKLSARVAAQRVRETGQPFRFNPMSPRERRLIHLELNGAQGVRTASEGAGDRRQLVVYPANKK
ncbi:MAG: R3H domain-containing nucleic acid-binding protein [Candidatus Acidiferrales bacterium]|jgi:spoIIIJ-associated protein